MGLTLRSFAVAEWRNLWQWLVDEIDGYMRIAALGDRLADALPDGTVGDFVRSLPKLGEGDALLGAEFDPSIAQTSKAERAVRRLFVGAMRVGTLDMRVGAYFEGADEAMQQLTPSWLRHRVDDWKDRPLSAFAVDLVEELVTRSQRLALAKASFDPEQGRYRIPTRVFVRDGYVYRDSTEGGGGVSLRFGTMTTVMAAVGLLEWGSDGWALTELGREV